MRILLIEDEAAAARTLAEELGFAGLEAEVSVSRSRTSALDALARMDADWDAILCDLLIPSVDGALDQSEEHGLLVLREARVLHPAARILILSGFATMKNVGGIVNRPEVDLYGTGIRIPMVVDTPKSDYGRCMRELRTISDELDRLVSIRIEAPFELPPPDERSLRVLARQKGGSRVEVLSAAAGLSDAVPIRVRIFTDQGAVRGAAFVKLGPTGAIQAEESRFNQYVSGVLPAGSFPSVVQHFESTRGRSALTYALIASPARSLFDVLATDQSAAVKLVSQVRAQEAMYWAEGGQVVTTTVGGMRDARGGDVGQAALHLDGLDWQWLESQSVETQQIIQHGDMHGENIMVDSSGRPFLIDFAQTGLMIAPCDAVTLELSLVFHPSGRAVASGWPSVGDLEGWASVSGYAAAAPFPEFVHACREWADSSPGGDAAVFSAAYAHAVRQLNYRDVDPALVRAIVSSVIAGWRKTMSPEA